jgi:23S rRNA-/tRNA-specific pseudouridylate synthase/SAM-dependent methyltransferase
VSPPPPTPAPTERRLSRGVRIVHEDDDLLVVDKPIGLITADPAAAAGRPAVKAGSTLFDILKKHVKGPFETRRPPRRKHGEGERATATKLWIIHRLDKEASGLLVFAKTEPAFRWLKEELRSKRMGRVYSAVAEGALGTPGETGTIQSYISDDSTGLTGRGRGAINRSRTGPTTSDDDQSKLAITHYRVAAVGSARTLLEVKLDTGRKNQIRIHFSKKGFPLVGDQRFGAKTDAIGRLALHAAELSFAPRPSAPPITFQSPAPAAFYRCVGAEAPPAAATSPPRAPARTNQPPASSPATVPETSWNSVAGWYDDLLEDRGNDHYEQIVMPGALRLLDAKPGSRILDVACGQGILSRRLASLGVEVVGGEGSPQLVETARRRSAEPPRGAAPIRYEVGDAREPDKLRLSGFDAAACIMALSNIDPLAPVMRGVATALKPGGAFVWIITHPAFRAIDQSSWGWDTGQERQYRRIDGYLSPGRKQVQMNPGKAARGSAPTTTWTFHRPLQAYIQAMAAAGLLIERLEEWPSLRASSSGPRAAEENRARREIPLFIGVRGVKAG